MSPEFDVEGPSCLRFWYLLDTYLEVKLTSVLDTKTLALFEVNGGDVFHETFIELPTGISNLIFETINGNRAALDDIRVEPDTCSDISKLRDQQTMGHWSTYL